jgi:hypothetical protein
MFVFELKTRSCLLDNGQKERQKAPKHGGKVNFLVIWSDYLVRRWSENPPTRVKSGRKSESLVNFRGEIGQFLFNISRNGGVLDRNRAFSKKTKWIIGSKTRVVKKSSEFCQERNVGFYAKNGVEREKGAPFWEETGVCREENLCF